MVYQYTYGRSFDFQSTQPKDKRHNLFECETTKNGTLFHLLSIYPYRIISATMNPKKSYSIDNGRVLYSNQFAVISPKGRKFLVTSYDRDVRKKCNSFANTCVYLLRKTYGEERENEHFKKEKMILVPYGFDPDRLVRAAGRAIDAVMNTRSLSIPARRELVKECLLNRFVVDHVTGMNPDEMKDELAHLLAIEAQQGYKEALEFEMEAHTSPKCSHSIWISLTTRSFVILDDNGKIDIMKYLEI